MCERLDIDTFIFNPISEFCDMVEYEIAICFSCGGERAEYDLDDFIETERSLWEEIGPVNKIFCFLHCLKCNELSAIIDMQGNYKE